MDSDWDSAYQVEPWIVGFVVGLLLFYIQNQNPRYWIIVYGIFFCFQDFHQKQIKNEVEVAPFKSQKSWP